MSLLYFLSWADENNVPSPESCWSTREQKLDLQIDALKRAGGEKIFSDVVSGASKERPANH